MSYEDSRLGRLRCAIETGASAFAVDQTATPSNFIDIPFREGTVSAEKPIEMQDPSTTQGYKDQYDKKLIGRMSTTLSFDVNIGGTGVALDGIVAPKTSADWYLARLLETMMGGLQSETAPGVATTVQAASTTTMINVTAGHGTSRFAPGKAIACQVAGRYECREILSSTANSVTVKNAFSAIPLPGTPCLGSYTFFLAESPANTLQFIHEGREQSDRYAYLGLQGGFSISLEPGGVPYITPSLAGAWWRSLTPAAFTQPVITNYNPLVVVDSEMLVQSVGVSTRNVVHAVSPTWTPGIEYTNPTSTAGVQTLLPPVRMHARALTVSFQPYHDSAAPLDWYALRDARTDVSVFQQLGSALTGSGVVLLSAPTCQIVDVQRADNSNVMGMSVSLEARHDSTLGGSSELLRSAFRIHVFR